MKLPVIFIILITFAMCNKGKSVDEFRVPLEGDHVQLIFSYPCNSTRITLQNGKTPFYTFTDSESIVLPPIQVDRFIFKNENTSDHCSLQLEIDPVMRTDAGTYIFFAYGDDGIFEHENSFITTEVHVDYLPGHASCTVSEEHTEGNWVLLDCIAPVGSLPGLIDCYQNGERMPPLAEPVETNTNLKQTVLVKKTQPVFCCSSTPEYSKDRCTCNDFQWDLANDKYVSTVVEPCSSTKPISRGKETSKMASFPSSPTSAEETTIRINNANDSVPWKYVVLYLGSILIVSGFASFVIVKLKIRNS